MTQIAILLSYYNGKKFIDEQIESLLNQSIKVDIYIRNDGSTCRYSIAKLDELSSEYSNVYVINAINVGVAKSFIELLNIVDNYDYYAFCDQDDYWLDSKLEVAINKLDKIDTPALYCSSYTMVDSNLSKLKVQQISFKPSFDRAVFKNYCTGCTTVINRKLKDIIQTNNVDFEVPMHDWCFLLTAYLVGTVIYDEDSYILYRQHGNNVVGGLDTNWKKLIRYFRYILQNNETRSEMAVNLLNTITPVNSQNGIFLNDIIQGKSSFIVRCEIAKNVIKHFDSLIDKVSMAIVLMLGRY
jgi:glycosyltransferase involved in cell wall biosynthesis